jgi:HAD superfamily hydrolase (TIGR01509 family)
MIKAVFWDNDGVLVDTEHLYFDATREALESVGIELTPEQYVQYFLVEGRGAWHLAEARGIPPGRIERLKEQRNDLYARRLASEPCLIAGVSQVLDRLHGRYVMGVVTSSRRDHFDVIHRATGLMKYFDFVLALGDYARSKPEPDPYARAIERSGAAPEECVAVEDSERGLASAIRAGIRCIVVPGTLTRGRPFAGAHHVVKSVAEVPALL